MSADKGCNHEPIPRLDDGPCGQPIKHKNRCGSCCDCGWMLKAYNAWITLGITQVLITVTATDCVNARKVAREQFKTTGTKINGEVRVRRWKYNGEIIPISE